MRSNGSRGFALLIVLALATAALVTAVGLSSTSRRAGAVAVIEEGGSIADSLARTGLHRGVAYALQVSGANNGDFDLVLDPQLEADCATSLGGGNPFNFAQVDGTNDIFRPMFTDAAADVEWPTGSDVWWRVVADSGGAYLVRFEDDEDDIATDAAFDPLTANNAGSGACFEGPNDAVTFPEGYLGATNPVRDRNRSIWVISVGIYRGTNPDAAHYRATRRQLLVDVSAASGFADPAFHADRVRAENSARILLHSDEAPARANEFHGHGALFSGCQLQSGLFHDDASDFSDPGALVCGTNAHALNTGPTPTLPLALMSTRYMDFNSPCNFVMRNFDVGGDPEGIWFWDHLGVRSFGECGDVSDFASIPLPDNGSAAQDLDNPGSCWVPVMASPASDGTIYDPCDLQEAHAANGGGSPIPTVDSGTGVYPPGGASPDTGADPAYWLPTDTAYTSPTPTTCNGYFDATVVIHKPAWDATCGGGVSFPPVVAGPPNPNIWPCTGCDGSLWAIELGNAGNPQDDFVTFNQVSSSQQPLPRGLYILHGDWTTSEVNVAGPPADQVTGYPPVTLIVTGQLVMRNNAVLAFGSGGHPVGDTPDVQNAYPSLIVGDALRLENNAQLYAAGGVYYTDGTPTEVNLLNSSLLRVYGPWVSSSGVQVRVENSAQFEWIYMTPFFAGGSTSVVSGSTVRMAFPLRL